MLNYIDQIFSNTKGKEFNIQENPLHSNQEIFNYDQIL